MKPLAVSLTACGGGSASDPAGSGTEVNTYRGEVLTCIERGLGKTRERSCDFAAFYAAHPDLLTASPEDTSTEGVWWTTYEGKEMPCYREGRGETATLSCDFDWFYALHGAPTR